MLGDVEYMLDAEIVSSSELTQICTGGTSTITSCTQNSSHTVLRHSVRYDVAEKDFKPLAMSLGNHAVSNIHLLRLNMAEQVEQRQIQPKYQHDFAI